MRSKLIKLASYVELWWTCLFFVAWCFSLNKLASNDSLNKNNSGSSTSSSSLRSSVIAEFSAKIFSHWSSLLHDSLDLFSLNRLKLVLLICALRLKIIFLESNQLVIRSYDSFQKLKNGEPLNFFVYRFEQFFAIEIFWKMKGLNKEFFFAPIFCLSVF